MFSLKQLLSVQVCSSLRRCIASNRRYSMNTFPRYSENFAAQFSDNDVPRITVPHKMQARMMKEQKKKQDHQRQAIRNYKGPKIISCKRKQFDHYKGQTYSDFSPQHLASSGWKHSGANGDHFTIQSWSGNPAFQQIDGSPQTFSDLGLNKEIIAALHDMDIKQPTNIQAQAIPPMLKGKHCMCVAETGSGKTLAYLLPIMQLIHQHNQQYGGSDETNSPRAVILVPSRELAIQIHSVAEKFKKHALIFPHVEIGGMGTKTLVQSRKQHTMDILISTPGVFSKMMTKKMYRMDQLQSVILDEADTLLDDSFNDKVLHLIQRIRVACGHSETLGSGDADQTQAGTSLSFVGATLPRDVQNILSGVVPSSGITNITTDSVHKVMPHVPQKFLRLSADSKAVELLRLLKANVKKRIPTLVFCNKLDTVNFLGHTLDNNGVPNIHFHADMKQHVRAGRFEKFQSGEVDVLICTDIASRGLDTTRAQHLINYDFPLYPSDYIHRVGRVGRVGNKHTCYVVNFISYKHDVDLLWKIETSVRRTAQGVTSQLWNVNANIKRKIVGRHNKLNDDGVAEIDSVLKPEETENGGDNQHVSRLL